MTDVIPLRGNDILQLAASLERGSEHSLAEAIVEKAKEQNLSLAQASGFQAIPGHGVSGDVNNQPLFLGNRALMEKRSIDFTSSERQVTKLESEGKTVMFLASSQKLLGLIAVADTLKIEAKATVDALHQAKIDVWMITGDNKRTAAAIAKQVGIKNVLAQVLPQDKAAKVSEFKKKTNGAVAFVGDGINDAPALAASDVGIAMGTGTDVAMESAGITLLNKDLRSVVSAIKLSKSTLSIIKQNLFWAFGYNVILIPVAMGILYPATGWLLNPALAAFAMAASSISVVGNSLRLKGVKIIE